MGSQTIILGLSCTLFYAVVSAQVYVLGGKEGSYQVPGVPGVFQYSPSTRTHTYSKGDNIVFTHSKDGEGSDGASTHTIKSPNLNAQNGPIRHRSARYAHTAGPSHHGHSAKENKPVSGATHSTNDRETHGQHVHSMHTHRIRREPQFGYVSRPDGRSVIYNKAGGAIAIGADGRTAAHIRRRRQKVQGENFVANGNQAGIWRDDISVWKRPNGRTVSVDKDGKILVTGRFGTQVYYR